MAKQHLTEAEAHARCDAINPHLRAHQHEQLVVTRKDGHWFIVLKQLPRSGRIEPPILTRSPALRKMEADYGLPVGPEVYTLDDYFAQGTLGPENKRRAASLPFKVER